MSDKSGKRFPLSLSSVIEKPLRQTRRRILPGRQMVTPQTATQNSARDKACNASRIYTHGQYENADTSDAAIIGRSTPLVSDAVRKAMVVRLAKQGVKDAMVLAAMEAVPRHFFMEPALASQAYIDASLPIGHQQTISKPYIVAKMLEIMRNNSTCATLDRVLEIGTGCGYQAAVLSLVAKEVYSIERIKSLHELAKANLRPLRIANIRLHYGDGMLGLPQVAPFDGIILAAAGAEVPRALLEQMAVGGRLVAPIGINRQILQLVERVSQFEWTTTMLEDCHFVPLRAGTI